jgi:hypothetical protein
MSIYGSVVDEDFRIPYFKCLLEIGLSLDDISKNYNLTREEMDILKKVD